MALQGSGVGYPWWIHQDYPLAPLAGVRQRREQQSELTQAGIPGDQFGYRAQWPAFTWQARIQLRKTGGQGTLATACLAPPPKLRHRFEQFIDGMFMWHGGSWERAILWERAMPAIS